MQYCVSNDILVKDLLMADLLVRGVEETFVRALNARAGANGRSAEAEHREILLAALLGPRKRRFAEALASMPNVGRDEDFVGVADTGTSIEDAPDVFA
jgi:plasmid stability protein